MNSVAGTPNWIAPEVFSGSYTEKADAFSLGAIFLAILQWDFVMIDGKPFYGGFQHIPGVGKVDLGYAMAIYDPNISMELSSVAQENPFHRLALKALQYNPDDRLTAGEIHIIFEAIRVGIIEYLRGYFTTILALIRELLPVRLLIGFS